MPRALKSILVQPTAPGETLNSAVNRALDKLNGYHSLRIISSTDVGPDECRIIYAANQESGGKALPTTMADIDVTPKPKAAAKVALMEDDKVVAEVEDEVGDLLTADSAGINATPLAEDPKTFNVDEPHPTY